MDRSGVKKADPGDLWAADPPATTAYDLVMETRLLRLRRYRPTAEPADCPPVLLVYSLIKRPYILDLLPERSIVRSLLDAGLVVYMTDWRPPADADRGCGLDAYINGHLAPAIETIRLREKATRVSLLGSCCGGLLASLYAALYPEKVASLATFAAPFASGPPVDEITAAAVCGTYGNVPAWMVHAVLNMRVPNAAKLPDFLARELDEPALRDHDSKDEPELLGAVGRWLDSDVPLAGQVFLDVVCGVLGKRQLVDGSARIDGRPVELSRIDCPVLSIAGSKDMLVPPAQVAPFASAVRSRHALNLVVPTGHLGLMLGRLAHRELWPGVAVWLRLQGEESADELVIAGHESGRAPPLESGATLSV